ncbi:hypothetical protein FQN54_008971 [Arachnomyces sp. PD_36]|nr:hypothetical protein FQN54_008971 [Arachnomyces sp. PD_36]
MESLLKPDEKRSLQDLQQSPALWYKVHVFVYDLRHFREKFASEARLEKVIDPLYIGPPYFKEDEVETLKNVMVQGKTLVQLIENTLSERLNRRDKKRVSSGDFRVCAAHDLAPILEKALGIDPKKLAKDCVFVRILEERGLRLGDGEWSGLPKKSFNPADKKGKRKSRK